MLDTVCRPVERPRGKGILAAVARNGPHEGPWSRPVTPSAIDAWVGIPFPDHFPRVAVPLLCGSDK